MQMQFVSLMVQDVFSIIDMKHSTFLYRSARINRYYLKVAEEQERGFLTPQSGRSASASNAPAARAPRNDQSSTVSPKASLGASRIVAGRGCKSRRAQY